MPNDLRRSNQTHKFIKRNSSRRSTNTSKAGSTLKSSATVADTNITPPIVQSSFIPTKRSAASSKMEEESIAIVSTNTSDADASSISSLSGGSLSSSSSSSSLQTAATSNASNIADDKSKDNNTLLSSIDESLADIDKTPVSYELSLSMYDGLLETCRPFYFGEPSSSSNVVHKIPPRLEDAIEMQEDKARSSSLASPSRKRASPTLLDDNNKNGGRKVRVKTITFQEPSPASRKKSKSYK